MIVFLAYLSFLFFLWRLIKMAGKEFPVIDLIIILYLVQYVIAAHLDYTYNDMNTMEVNESEYLPFGLFSVLFFAGGLLSIKSKVSLNKLSFSPIVASKLGRLLVLIGFGSELIYIVVPPEIGSTFYFLTLFKSIGVFSLVFSNYKADKIIVILFTILIAISAIINSILIEFIIFVTFLSMFFLLKYKINRLFRIIFISISFLLLILYQGIKTEYRKLTWENNFKTESNSAILINLISKQDLNSIFDFDFRNNDAFIATIIRLNQGWHVSKVVNNVPEITPYQYGRELINDVISAFAPRIIWKNKRIVNDQDKFFRFTGHRLKGSTSMSVGVIGDLYLNFGLYGTVIFIFILGRLIAMFLEWYISKYVKLNPINLIWLPFLFYYLVRPGNEFYMVFNHFVKALLVLFLFQKFIYPKLGFKTVLRKYN